MVRSVCEVMDGEKCVFDIMLVAVVGPSIVEMK